MIETRDQYLDFWAGGYVDTRKRLALAKTFEALRKVARAAKLAEEFNPGYLTPSIMRAIDALPDWLLEERDD